MYHDPLVTRHALPSFLVPQPMAADPTGLAGPLEAVVLASEPCDEEIVAVGELVAVAHPELPPGRVRHMFKKLDANGDKVLTLAELESGFEKEGLLSATPHVREAIPQMFEAHATHDEKLGKKVLKIGVFSRFYAQVLFKHFDANNNGSLDRTEAQAALRFLLKPKDGSTPEVAVAIPASAEKDGELQLPFSWFWDQYQAMD